MGCSSSQVSPEAELTPVTPTEQRAAQKEAKARVALVASAPTPAAAAALVDLLPGAVEAAAKAKAAQEALVAAADAASPEVKAKVGDEYKKKGGPALEPLFEHTDLVDVNYLIGLAQAGGVVPSWSDLPDCAKINTANLWRLRCWDLGYSLPILVLSCACTSRSPAHALQAHTCQPLTLRCVCERVRRPVARQAPPGQAWGDAPAHPAHPDRLP